MKINKYVSSVITLDLLYYHKHIWKTQVKQTLGVGFAYHIGNCKKGSNKKNNQTWK